MCVVVSQRLSAVLVSLKKTEKSSHRASKIFEAVEGEAIEGEVIV